MPDLTTTAVAMHDGVAAVTDVTEQTTVTFGGTWVSGETFNVFLTNAATASQHRFGAGPVSGLTPTFALTFAGKMYAAAGTTLCFSAIATPNRFDDVITVGGEDGDDPGNGFIVPGNNYSTPENIVALANYQGKLAVINRRSTQIWRMAADPADNTLAQTLENIGTFAAETAKPVGTLDVMMLADTGFRSLRVRESFDSAMVIDVGTPIDRDVQTHLATLSEVQKAASCSVVEPTSNRYWAFVPNANPSSSNYGTIYVLSYFPSSNISAWSTYTPSYQSAGVNTPFIPQKFVVKDGRVYARTSDGLIAYGGSDGNTYENCGVTAETPWLDAKTPATRKTSSAVDVACQGTWTVSLGMDPATQPGTVTLKQVYYKANAANASSFNLGQIPTRMQGTHFKLKMVESSTGYARFSSAAFHYQQNEAS